MGGIAAPDPLKEMLHDTLEDDIFRREQPSGFGELVYAINQHAIRLALASTPGIDPELFKRNYRRVVASDLRRTGSLLKQQDIRDLLEWLDPIENETENPFPGTRVRYEGSPTMVKVIYYREANRDLVYHTYTSKQRMWITAVLVRPEHRCRWLSAEYIAQEAEASSWKEVSSVLKSLRGTIRCLLGRKPMFTGVTYFTEFCLAAESVEELENIYF